MTKVIFIPALLLVFTSLFAQNLNAQTPGFQEFLAQFPKSTLPYSIGEQDLTANAATAATRLDWEYYEFLPELERSAQFSRTPVYPEPVAMFETEQYYAVLYNIARGTQKGKTFSVSVYDKEGNYLATNYVAGINAKSMVTVEITAELTAKVQLFQIINGAADLQSTMPLDLIIPGNPDQIDWSVAPSDNCNVAAIGEK